jgi:hypothetical protein
VFRVAEPLIDYMLSLDGNGTLDQSFGQRNNDGTNDIQGASGREVFAALQSQIGPADEGCIGRHRNHRVWMEGRHRNLFA